MILSHLDPRLNWIGAISLERTADFTRACRLPSRERNLAFPTLQERAMTPAGVRIAFRSDTRSLWGVRLATEETQKLDLALDGKLHGSIDLKGVAEFAWDDLPAGEKLIELWLPQRCDFALRELQIDDGASILPYQDQRPLWVAYGSSITHCGEAASPTMTWPAIVAREMGVNHINLGYGGQCHLDPLVARMIRDIPSIDFLSICAGINICSSNSLNARSFPSALIGTIQTIRERHPRTPLAVISPIYAADYETRPNLLGLALVDYRKMVKETVALLQAEGDRHLFDVDGLSIYGESLGHLMPDKVHPNAEGYCRLAEGFLREVAPRLFATLPR